MKKILSFSVLLSLCACVPFSVRYPKVSLDEKASENIVNEKDIWRMRTVFSGDYSRSCGGWQYDWDWCISMGKYDGDKMSPDAVKRFIEVYNKRFDTKFNSMVDVKITRQLPIFSAWLYTYFITGTLVEIQ